MSREFRKNFSGGGNCSGSCTQEPSDAIRSGNNRFADPLITETLGGGQDRLSAVNTVGINGSKAARYKA